MTEIGETVGMLELVSDDKHDEKTCPWPHDDASDDGSDQPMDPQEADEDAKVVPKNLGKKLGDNLNKAGDNPPAANSVTIGFKDTANFYMHGKKKVRIYEKDNRAEVEYELKYAPHHLIPGNESLAGSQLAAYLGGIDIIEHFKGKGPQKVTESKIVDGKSAGYDVNVARNGVWLPSPYALSMDNKWPADPGIKAIKRRQNVFGRKGEEVGTELEEFKMAYAAASIESSGMRQFHLRHGQYSTEVRNVIDKIASKLIAFGEEDPCPFASDKKNKDSNGKMKKAPTGLPDRLHILSNNLRNLLTGSVWRPPFYLDGLSEEYIADSQKTGKLTKTDSKGDLKKVL